MLGEGKTGGKRAESRVKSHSINMRRNTVIGWLQPEMKIHLNYTLEMHGEGKQVPNLNKYFLISL